MKNGGEIDFVIIWVDGSDPKWLAEKAKYAPPADTDSRPERYRDWGLLPYWFRGVEKFAPWVRKIHFVTWGHIPKWLNTSHPKLNIVRHEDYIPEKYLPTFSSHTIELNLHRIEGLSGNFVYFNDDTFIISPVSEKVFFKKGLPCDSAVLTVHCVQRGAKGELVQQVSLNDVSIINSDFDVHKTFRAAPQKWLNLRYGTKLLRQIPLLFCSGFSGFYQIHLPNSFKKSTFDEVWEREYDILDKTCMNKFRCSSDVNQWFLRQWQLAKNEFCPRSIGTGKSFSSDRYGKEDFDRAAQYISRQKGKMICINDGILTEKEFGYYSEMMRNAFDSILPDRSSFEV